MANTLCSEPRKRESERESESEREKARENRERESEREGERASEREKMDGRKGSSVFEKATANSAYDADMYISVCLCPRGQEKKLHGLFRSFTSLFVMFNANRKD